MDSNNSNLCSQCGAPLGSDGECDACHQNPFSASVNATEKPTESTESSATELTEPFAEGFANSETRPQFSITSIIVATTVVAAICALLRVLPGLGIIVAAIVTPAFLRASVIAGRAKIAGAPLSVGGAFYAFLGSTGVVLLTLMSMGLAFYITCWGGFIAGAILSEVGGARGLDGLGYGLVTGVIVGIIGQLGYLGFFTYWLWSKRHEKRNRLGDIGFIVAWVGFAIVYSIGFVQLFTPTQGLLEMSWFGFVAAPGLIMSWITLFRPHRAMSSCGVAVGTAACLLSGVFVASLAGGVLTPLVISVALLIGAVGAVLGSFAVYYLVGSIVGRRAAV